MLDSGSACGWRSCRHHRNQPTNLISEFGRVNARSCHQCGCEDLTIATAASQQPRSVNMDLRIGQHPQQECEDKPISEDGGVDAWWCPPHGCENPTTAAATYQWRWGCGCLMMPSTWVWKPYNCSSNLSTNLSVKMRVWTSDDALNIGMKTLQLS